MIDDRISRLSRRFKEHAVGRPSSSGRIRERRSFYFDGQLIDSLERAYRQLNHELYPKRVSKSVFLESIMEYGLERIEEIKAGLPIGDENERGGAE